MLVKPKWSDVRRHFFLRGKTATPAENMNALDRPLLLCMLVPAPGNSIAASTAVAYCSIETIPVPASTPALVYTCMQMQTHTHTLSSSTCQLHDSAIRPLKIY